MQQVFVQNQGSPIPQTKKHTKSGCLGYIGHFYVCTQLYGYFYKPIVRYFNNNK